MLDLLLTVCMIADPSNCKVQRIEFQGSQMECAFGGQYTASAWLAEHPKWKLTKWRCKTPEREA